MRLLATVLLGCAPEQTPSNEESSVFPWAYTPQTDLEPWDDVRVETETWTPEDDPAQLALYLQKAAVHRKSAPIESLEHFARQRKLLPALGAGTTLSLAGDTMWVGSNWSELALPVTGLFDGDLRVANLETPTSTSASTEQGDLGIYAFNAPPELIDSLPVDVLQLNNNHTLDAGDQGVSETVAEVEQRDIVPAGVNTHAMVDGVALLSYTWGLNQKGVTPADELFIVPFGHLDEPIDLSGVAADIGAARATGATSVVTLLHWGYEYEYYPDPHFMVLAREIITAGADLVVGSGPHVAQPAEICTVNDPDDAPGVGHCAITTDDGEPRTAAVLYSLGNFAAIMATIPCQVGVVATVSLDPDVTGLGWAPVVTLDDGTGPRVEPLDDHLDDADLAAESTRLDAHLGSDWRR